MKLIDYMKKEKVKPIKFASDLGISLATYYNWINGTVRPSLDHLLQIKKYTNNKVLLEDFYE